MSGRAFTLPAEFVPAVSFIKSHSEHHLVREFAGLVHRGTRFSPVLPRRLLSLCQRAGLRPDDRGELLLAFVLIGFRQSPVRRAALLMRAVQQLEVDLTIPVWSMSDGPPSYRPVDWGDGGGGGRVVWVGGPIPGMPTAEPKPVPSSSPGAGSPPSSPSPSPRPARPMPFGVGARPARPGRR